MTTAPDPPVPAAPRAAAVARTICDAFEDYHARFARISGRARRRFESRDWNAARNDAVERIALYDRCIGECMLRLRTLLLGQTHDRALWAQVRDGFAAQLHGLIDQEL